MTPRRRAAAPSDPVARRAVLDHIVDLVAQSSLADRLVLRGSMAMLAWFGDRARTPGDLDFIVRPMAGVPIDQIDPFPYLDHLDRVQTWPEVAHGAGRYRMWAFEEFHLSGATRARVPPEGLHWITDEDSGSDLCRPHDDLVNLVRAKPHVAGGLFLDVDRAGYVGGYGYDTSGSDYAYSGPGNMRIILPWHTGDRPSPEGSSGEIQVDFAYDEVLADPPVLIAVPRAAGGQPAPLWAADATQSLMWKLQWLATDHARLGSCEGKDLYDAVLLAEMGPQPSPRLRRRLRLRLPTPDALDHGAAQRWRVDWSTVDDSHRPSDGSTWLARLASALDREWVQPARPE